jgi:aquaporin rerated protein, other eukaryote
MVLAGTLPVKRALFLFPAQIFGGIVAAALVSCMFPGDISAVNTTLAPGVSITQGLFIEAFLTAELVFTILVWTASRLF